MFHGLKYNLGFMPIKLWPWNIMHETNFTQFLDAW